MASGVNPKTGGKIRPDGRTPAAPGVGKSSRRHDLESTATPGLSNSSLQQGDVSELEQGQAIAPRAGAKNVQGQAKGGQKQGKGQSSRTPSTTGLEVPNPIDFANQRLGGTLGQGAQGQPQFIDVKGWLPILNRLISNPTSGGTLAQAYIQQLNQLIRRPFSPRITAIDMSELDQAVEQGFSDDTRG